MRSEEARLKLNLEGKVALVVASSKGLGKAVASELSQEGCHVMLTGRNSESLSKAHDSISNQARGKVVSHVCDITRPEQIKSLLEVTRKQLGPVDILVNNSGGPPGGGFDAVDDGQWQAAFELTLLSYIRLIRGVLPDMKKNRGGRIINLTSASVKQPIPGLILSNVFRLGVVGLSKTLADELAAFNILVTTVAPGRIATDRTSYLDQFNADKRGVCKEQIVEEAQNKIPLGRYGRTEEFAKVVCFLASEASSYMTGSVVSVDGGMIRSY